MWELIFLLFVFIIVIGLAYFITKKIASMGAHRMQGKNMEIIESLQIGVNQRIHLVKVGEKIIMIGVSKEHISFLSEAPIESIDLSAYKTPEDMPSFEDYLKKLIPRKKP